jgi:HlyD family secretion protein
MRISTRGATAPVPLPEHEKPSGQPQLVQPEPESPRRDWSGWIFFGFLLCFGLAAWWYARPDAQQSKRVAAVIRTATVRVASVRRTVRLTGVTAASRFSMLLAPTMTGSRRVHSHASGDFQQVLQSIAKSGTQVRKGDVVAEFDRIYMLTRLDDYKASVVQHEANLRSLNALLDVRRKNYEQTTIRYRGARDKAALETKKAPVLSAIRAENNQLNLQQYTSQLKEIMDEEKYFEISERSAIRRSELDLRVSRMEYERAQRNADALLVKAPIDGLVVMQTIRRGGDSAEVKEGDQLYPGQAFMQIVDTASLCVDAKVNQVDIERLRVGAAAEVTFDAYPGLTLPAEVVSIGAIASGGGWRASYVKDVPVRLKLRKLDPRAIPNFTVAADVLIEAAEGVPTVPRESLFVDPDDGKTVAFVRIPSGWEKRDVELGVQSPVDAEVKSGLNAGDVVATEWVAMTADQTANPK